MVTKKNELNEQKFWHLFVFSYRWKVTIESNRGYFDVRRHKKVSAYLNQYSTVILFSEVKCDQPSWETRKKSPILSFASSRVVMNACSIL